MFDIDEDLTIRIKKGETGKFMIENLPEEFNSYQARLVVKKNENSKDFNAPINQTRMINNKTVAFEITETDSYALITGDDKDMENYKWEVVAEDGTGQIAINVIPEQFKAMPNFIVYSEVIGEN